MKRHTTFSFTLLPTQAQEESLRRHVGAARFAHNQGLRLVKDALEAKQTSPGGTVPWTGFDLIQSFNNWKVSPSAGTDDEGRPGLPWRAEVCQQVFEEGVVDLARGLAAFSEGRRGTRKGRPPGFPKFKSKATARQSFRLRNKTNKEKGCIRFDEPRQLRLPKLGLLRVRENTRRLRQMLKKKRAKILFATVCYQAGRWVVQLTVEASKLNAARHHGAEATEPVGVDRGLQTFAVVADAGGHELERIQSPKPLKASLSRLKKENRALSRKQKGSRNRGRQRLKLARAHRRIANVRRDFVHRTSSRLAKTHGHLVLEDLCTVGLMRTRLARSVADSAWALFGIQLRYKLSWVNGRLTLADRFFPSTQRCSGCGKQREERLSLSQRTFHCSSCGFEIDRDTNAAANLAQYPDLAQSHVAAKQAETENARGEGSSGDAASRRSRNSPRRSRKSIRSTPEKGGADDTVNTL